MWQEQEKLEPPPAVQEGGAAHTHDQLWAAGAAAHAPPPSKGLLFRLSAGILLGVSTHAVVPSTSTEWVMRRVGRKYLRHEIRTMPRKSGGLGIKRPRNNGQDKGVAYPRRKIRKVLSG